MRRHRMILAAIISAAALLVFWLTSPRAVPRGRPQATEARGGGTARHEPAPPVHAASHHRVDDVRPASAESAGEELPILVEVRGADGSPSCRAVVIAVPEGAPRMVGLALASAEPDLIADANGRCRLDHARHRGRGVLLWATSEDGRESTPTTALAVPGESVVLTLASAACIRGRVTDIGLTDVTSIRVYASGGAWPELPGRRVLSVDGQGCFLLPGVREYFSVVAVAPRRVASPYIRRFLRDHDGSEVLLPLGEAAEPVRLRVVAEDGESFPTGWGALVQTGAGGWSPVAIQEGGILDCMAARDGCVDVQVYALRRPTGEWRTVSKRWTVSASAAMAAGTPLIVPSALRATFRLLTGTGEPVAGIPVTLSRTDLVQEADVAEAIAHVGVAPAATTDSDGRARPCSAIALEPGRFRLLSSNAVVLWEGALTAATREVEVRTSGIEFVDVTLVDGESRPICASSASVSLVDGNDGSSHGSADVSFRRSPKLTLAYDPSRIRVPAFRLSVPGCPDTIQPVAAGRDHSIRLPRDLGSLVIDVGRWRGADVAETECSVTLFLGEDRRVVHLARLDEADGTITIHAVAPGRYEGIRVSLPDNTHAMSGQPLQVTPGGTTRVSLTR